MNSFSSASVSACLHEDSCQLQKLPTEPGMEQEENEDVSLEWLSIFVEDCFFGNPTLSIPQNPTISPNLARQAQLLKPNKPFFGMKQFSSTKNRVKRRKLAILEEENILLLPQPYWLADSQLILPKRDFYENDKAKTKEEKEEEEEEEEEEEKGAQEQLGKERRQVQPRRCSHCLSQKTPQWRAGPLGPKTLCNACGVRFKSGGLLPEYRPVKSPTFVSCKHSNSHKKVMEMRMLMHTDQFGIKD